MQQLIRRINGCKFVTIRFDINGRHAPIVVGSRKDDEKGEVKMF